MLTKQQAEEIKELVDGNYFGQVLIKFSEYNIPKNRYSKLNQEFQDNKYSHSEMREKLYLLLHDFVQDNKKYEDELAKVQANNLILERKNKTNENLIEQLEAEIATLEEKLKTYKQNAKQTNNNQVEIEQFKTLITEKNNEIQKLTQQINTQDRLLTEKENIIKNLNQKINNLETEKNNIKIINKNYTETINNVSFEMIWVEGTDANNPFLFQGEKKIQLDSFYIAKFPTTQALYQAIMGNNPSYFKGTNKPVERVSWFDAVAFTEKLSMLTGKKYSLPSEAQWEYAAKGGRLSKGYTYAGSNNIDEVACYSKNSLDKGEKHADYGTHNVGRYKPNELGIYDMSGNVFEWCLDEYEEKVISKIPDNFLNPMYVNGNILNSITFDNKNRANNPIVLRGGSWFNYDDGASFAIRGDFNARDVNGFNGFRLFSLCPQYL
ncbi:MAG: hypothetical protein EAZ85_07560 [Bacteroidetes bacterium]|nr:MAG: hypothetical protein EAZ85_07560 [Bacteroidota bacterium]TAG93392.1 MAG: hypothetical protein EAZ20_01690 [Bacteroidota bacterium]